MNFIRTNTLLSLLVATVLSTSPAAFAKMPIRGSSQNGENSNAANWNLLSVGEPMTLSANGKKVIVTRQIICVNQDVENAFSSPNPLLTGTCDGKTYMHVFQFKSSSANVTVTLGQLVGFVENTAGGNYGVMVCDNNGNSLELCTNNPAEDNIPDITFAVAKNKTSVSFVVPSFPTYPVGTDNEGQGLTLFIIVNQSTSLPIQLPKVAIK
jgi:hypothetical protein